MRTPISFWLPLFLTACTCAGEPAKEGGDLQVQPNPSANNASDEAGDTVHLRGLFYYERATNSGVAGFPTHPDHPDSRGPGEQAWLEIHTSGANHAYAFALFDDGQILSLWNKDIEKSEHTPPMNAFSDGLALDEEYDSGATILVVAGEQTLNGLDDMGDCTQHETQACSNIRRMAQEGMSSAHSPDKPLRMKHRDIVTGAKAASNSGDGRCALAFKILPAI